MDRGERRARAVAGWAVAAAAAFWLHQRLYAGSEFYRYHVDMAFSDPVAPTKVLMMVGAGLVALALPLAIADWRAERRYRRAIRETHRRRFLSTYEPYEGPEGAGVLFTGPEGRLLLLKPLGGFGEARAIELPAPPTSVPVDAPPSPPAEQTSPGAQA